jgi:hypothetical protein
MMRKFFMSSLSIALSFVFLGCTVSLPWVMEIQTSTANSQSPIAKGVEVAVDGKFVGISDEQGKLAVPLSAGPLQTLKWSFRDQNAESLVLPQSFEIAAPDFWIWLKALGWQGVATYKMPPIVLAEVKWSEEAVSVEPEEAIPQEHIQETELSPLELQTLESSGSALGGSKVEPLVVVTADIGKDLDSLVPKIQIPLTDTTDNTGPSVGPKSQAILPNIQTEIDESLNAVLVSPDTAAFSETERNLDLKNTFRFLVKSQGKALPNTAISIWNSVSTRFIELGETDGHGELTTAFLFTQNADSVYLRHSCCVTQLRSLPKRPIKVKKNGLETLTFELLPGVSHDFWVGSRMYGVMRGVAKVALETGGRSFGSTSEQGLIQVVGKNLSEGPISLKATSQTELVSAVDKAFVLQDHTQINPYFLEVTLKERRPPILGILETVQGRFEASETSTLFNKGYRRFRRELITQLTRKMLFRSMQGQELVTLFRRYGLELPKSLTSGWDMSNVQGEVDYVLWIDRLQNDSVSLRLVAANGALEMNRTWDLQNAIPEEQGAHALSKLLSQFPFEVAVTQSQGQVGISKAWLDQIKDGEKFVRTEIAIAGTQEKPNQVCEAVLSKETLTLKAKGNCGSGIKIGDVFMHCAMSCGPTLKAPLANHKGLQKD